MRISGRMIRRRCSASAPLLALLLTLGQSLSSATAAAATQSYVIEWFSLASYSQPGDCPDGMNPPTRDQYPKDLQLLGYTPEQITRIMEDWVSNDQR